MKSVSLVAVFAIACAGGECPGLDRVGGFSPSPGHCMRITLDHGAGLLATGDACPAPDATCLVVTDGDVGHGYADVTVPGMYADEVRFEWVQAPLVEGACTLECSPP